jgi:CBS domain-containing protein
MPNIGDICNRSVVVVHRATPLTEVATIMRERHVGDTVVVDEHNGMRVPVGMVTDRDIVVAVIARCEPYLPTLTVGDLVARPPGVAHDEDDVFRVAHRMRTEGVRRMPVVDKYGGLVGIVTLDDLMKLLADTMMELSGIGPGQPRREARQRH